MAYLQQFQEIAIEYLVPLEHNKKIKDNSEPDKETC